jgi:hypothetical protein
MIRNSFPGHHAILKYTRYSSKGIRLSGHAFSAIHVSLAPQSIQRGMFCDLNIHHLMINYGQAYLIPA